MASEYVETMKNVQREGRTEKRVRAMDTHEIVSELHRLEDRIAELSAALAPFAEISGEGDEDFDDETDVVVTFGRTTHYALDLGDLRHAARIMAAFG